MSSNGKREGERLRLLLLLPFPPRLDAMHGGGRAMAQLLLHLAERHDLSLLYLRAPDEPPLDDALRAASVRAEEIRRRDVRPDVFRIRKRLRTLQTLLGGRPKWVGDCDLPIFREALRRLLAEWQPDIVQAEYHVMGQYLEMPETSTVPSVLTQYEPGTSAARDRWRASRGFRRIQARVELVVWERFERSILRRPDVVVVLTEKDRADLPAPPGCRIERIPLGTPLPEVPSDPARADDRTLLFIGNYTHPPNVDAAIHLAHEILPRVRERVPQAQLQLVGNRPPAAVENLAGPHVEVTGRVPDTTPYLQGAAVVTVPLRLGGGMRIKVMEALAAGRPVVASSLAVAGIDLADGEHALIRDDPDRFAMAVVDLLCDREARARLGRNGRRWAEKHLGWGTSVEAFDALYTNLLEKREGRNAKEDARSAA
jgi:polysaccharide biosynthesis protein PslH